MNSSPGNFRHLHRLTDDTGIAEHALGLIPRRKEGYSTDDQARALWACMEWMAFAPDSEKDGLYKLIDTYMAFLVWAQNDDGHFHNNFTYDRTREAESPSDDCLGRCLWAAALAYTGLNGHHRSLAALELLNRAILRVRDLRHPRGWAYALAAVSLLMRHSFPARLDSLRDMLTNRLLHGFRTHAAPEWVWFEPALTYGNGLLPWGLFCAYEVKRDGEILGAATQSLDFLIRHSMNGRGQIRPVGNKGWCTPGVRALWDQQPIDVMKLALASLKAYEMTGASRYADIVERCRGWFYGENDAGVPMCDPKEGSAFDGLEKDGANLNQGAESTISYLLTEVIWLKLDKMKRGAANATDRYEARPVAEASV